MPKGKDFDQTKRLSSLSTKKMDNTQPLTFQPVITKKSKEMNRDRPVEDILYEEAKRRKAKL